jgi:redox-sensitive bicupin YhaK (pirin superfamily)
MTRSAVPESGVDVRRAGARFVTRADGLLSSHSFSFGLHYDPLNTSYGQLLAHNDEVVDAGAGFAAHPHRDMEIVTWVLQGALAHADSTGHSGIVRPGQVQRTSAGRGIAHTEGSAAGEPVRFVQMWLPPDEPAGGPGSEQAELGEALLRGDLLPVASGVAHRDAAVRLGNRHAVLSVARLDPGQGVMLPEAPYLHLYLPRGSVELEGAGALDPGDAARLTATGGRRVTARTPAEILVWEMAADLGRPQLSAALTR